MKTPLQRNNVMLRGNPDAPRTLLFVHGFGTDQTAWSQVADSFQDEYRIVLLDNMGMGQSDLEAFDANPSDYLGLERYAGDVQEVCAYLRLKDVVLVGHSVGAMISVLAAAGRPELFAKLVLVGASPHYLNDGPYHGGFSQSDVNDITLSVARDYSCWAESFAPRAMGNPGSPQLAKEFAQCLKAMPVKRALHILYAIFRSDLRKVVQQLRLPTLIIQSRDDLFVPEEVAEYLHQHILGSRLSRIPASGHLPHISAPATVIAAMREFGL